jgi:hypothetical protein
MAVPVRDREHDQAQLLLNELADLGLALGRERVRL